MKMGKYQFNFEGHIRDIFKGKGFTVYYVDYKKLPLLNYKNEWVSGDIRLREINFPKFKDYTFQLYMKQQKLEYMFNIKFNKQDLMDSNFVVGFYEYEKYKNVYNYGIISLEEFLNRYRYNVSLKLLLEDIVIDDLEKAVLREKELYEEEKRQSKLLQKRITNIDKEIAEKRKEKVVYLVVELGDRFYIERYTKASKKVERVSTKEEVQEFIESNSRGDSRTGYVIVFVDKDYYKLNW